MNPTRLFILGALAKHGPMYGHQLRRDARLDRTELWSEVRPGSLYGALHRLAAEGLIEPLRTEQDGQLPARTVYGITEEGHRELRALRAEALQEVRLQPDPVDLALAMSRDLDPVILRGYLEDRVRALSARAAQFDHQRDRLWPGQTVADDLVVEHARLRIRAELEWHQLVLDQLGKLTADSQRPDSRPAAARRPDSERPDSRPAAARRPDSERPDSGPAAARRPDGERPDGERPDSERPDSEPGDEGAVGDQHTERARA